jgi:hypothetical protein
VQVLAVCREGGVTQIIADQPQFHLLIGHAGTCAMPKPVGGRLLKAAGPLFIWSPLARRRSAVPPKTSFTLLWSAARVKGLGLSPTGSTRGALSPAEGRADRSCARRYRLAAEP